MHLNIKTNYCFFKSFIKINNIIDETLKNKFSYLVINDENLFVSNIFYKKCLENNIKPILGLNLIVGKIEISFFAKNYKGYLKLIEIFYKKSEIKSEGISKFFTNDLIIVVTDEKLFFEIKNLEKYDVYFGLKNLKNINQKVNKEYLLDFRSVNCIKTEDKKYLYYYQLVSKLEKHSDSHLINNFLVNLFSLEEVLRKKVAFLINNEKKFIDKINFNILKKDVIKNISFIDDPIQVLKNELVQNFKIKIKSNRKLYLNRLRHELSVVRDLNFSNYFLIVYDYIKFAKKNNILVGPGRGSAPGSLICYLLGITEVDPIKYNLFFERFLNKGRKKLPDIDVDFEDEKRFLIFDYLSKKYGFDHFANIITFQLSKAKNSIRDAMRVFSFEQEKINYVSKMINPLENIRKNIDNNTKLKQILSSDLKFQEVRKFSQLMENQPRNISLHAAGVILSKQKLFNIIPAFKNESINRICSGLTMHNLEQNGLIKFDILGLKTLSLISSILKMIKLNHNIDLNWEEIDYEDEETFNMINKGYTFGCFQIETPGMTKHIKDIKVNSLEEISILLAIFRPGPKKQIPVYVRRKIGKEKFEYYDNSIEGILEPTKGIIIFQEQVIQIFNTYAGFTLEESDEIRKILTSKNLKDFSKIKLTFFEKSSALGRDITKTEKIFNYLIEFTKYGFNKSHAISYAMLTFQTAYLKMHFPIYFTVAILNTFIGNHIKQKILMEEMNSLLNISLLKPNINESEDFFTMNSKNNKLINYGFLAISGLGQTFTNLVLKERKKNGKFLNYPNAVFRLTNAKLPKSAIMLLIESGAFDDFNYNRKTMMLNLDELINNKDIEVFLLDKINDLIQYYEEDDKILAKAYNNTGILEKNTRYNKIFKKIIERDAICFPLSKLNDTNLRNIRILFKLNDYKEVTSFKNKTYLLLNITDSILEFNLILAGNKMEMYSKILVHDKYYIANINIVNFKSKKNLFVESLEIFKENET